jgi:hypothetical protein
MDANRERPWPAFRNWAIMSGWMGLFMLVFEPWRQGRALEIETVKGYAVWVTTFAIVMMGQAVVARSMPSWLPANYSGENGRTPQCAYVVVGIGLLIALATIGGVFASIAWEARNA